MPDGVAFEAYMNHFADRIQLAAMRPGDVILLRYDTHRQHAAILGDYKYGGLSMIHAMSVPKLGVREHRIDNTWRRRIVAAYSIPGVE